MASRKRIYLLISSALVLAAVLSLWVSRQPSTGRAERRVQAFVKAINYDYKDPARIYPFLEASYKAQISEQAFVDAFTKERSYPYLTPLFLNFESLTMEADKRRGVARFSQAARLPGMFVEIPVIYEKGDYYCRFFEEFLDGSYLDKFERLSREGK